MHINTDKFLGGNLRNNFLPWKKITSDTLILNIVQQDLKLSFTGDILTNVPFEYKRSQLEHSVIDEEVCTSQIFLLDPKKTDHIVLSQI